MGSVVFHLQFLCFEQMHAFHALPSSTSSTGWVIHLSFISTQVSSFLPSSWKRTKNVLLWTLRFTHRAHTGPQETFAHSLSQKLCECRPIIVQQQPAFSLPPKQLDSPSPDSGFPGQEPSHIHTDSLTAGESASYPSGSLQPL